MKPTTPKPDRARRPKLRASCDACAASKVKCSKDHPVCVRCTANGLQCVYGVSRKHGKPGRVRKRNADGTLAVKGKKEGLGRFRVRIEGGCAGGVESAKVWEGAVGLGFGDVEPLCADDMGFPLGGYPGSEPQMDSFPLDLNLNFDDPFAETPSVQLESPHLQALHDYMNPFDSPFPDVGLGITLDSSPSPSPKTLPTSTMNLAMPTSHCCSGLAHSTLESLHTAPPHPTQPWPDMETKTLDAVLSTTKLAVQSITQLLRCRCRCAADPHIAMLYASMTCQILMWYQIAAGVSPASAPSVGSSPLATPGCERAAFSVQRPALRFGAYEIDEGVQERMGRRVLLRELGRCGGLVEVLGGWRGGGQAEFLYGVLGGWLRGELDRTVGGMGDTTSTVF